jgi:hypothetical protein
MSHGHFEKGFGPDEDDSETVEPRGGVSPHLRRQAQLLRAEAVEELFLGPAGLPGDLRKEAA